MRINRTQRTLIRPRVPVHKAHCGNHLPVWRSSPQPSRPQRAPAAPSAPAKSPIAPAEPGAPLPALSFLGGFRTTAPVLVASSEMGRHPKPVTKPARLLSARMSPFAGCPEDPKLILRGIGPGVGTVIELYRTGPIEGFKPHGPDYP